MENFSILKSFVTFFYTFIVTNKNVITIKYEKSILSIFSIRYASKNGHNIHLK